MNSQETSRRAFLAHTAKVLSAYFMPKFPLGATPANLENLVAVHGIHQGNITSKVYEIIGLLVKSPEQDKPKNFMGFNVANDRKPISMPEHNVHGYLTDVVFEMENEFAGVSCFVSHNEPYRLSYIRYIILGTNENGSWDSPVVRGSYDGTPYMVMTRSSAPIATEPKLDGRLDFVIPPIRQAGNFSKTSHYGGALKKELIESAGTLLQAKFEYVPFTGRYADYSRDYLKILGKLKEFLEIGKA